MLPMPKTKRGFQHYYYYYYNLEKGFLKDVMNTLEKNNFVELFGHYASFKSSVKHLRTVIWSSIYL